MAATVDRTQEEARYGVRMVRMIGICAGWLAGQITKGSGFGIVGDLIVGVIGALLGGFAFRMVGIAA
jgi:uncharacterized membrane protein YeaQ/YmgE (transglycosylase-associated protein family)